MADKIVYKKMTRKADKGLEGKVVAERSENLSKSSERNEKVLKTNGFQHFWWR